MIKEMTHGSLSTSGIVVGAAIGFGIGYYLWKTRWKPDQEAAHAQLTADLNKRREMAEREL